MVAAGGRTRRGAGGGGGSGGGAALGDGTADAPALPEDASGLWGHVAALPPKQRAALALRFVADAGYDEIAAVMDTSQEAARRNVHEGLTKLRKEYRSP